VSPAFVVFMFFLLPSVNNCFQLFPLQVPACHNTGRTEWRRYADQIPAWPPDIVNSILCKFPRNSETTARIDLLVDLQFGSIPYGPGAPRA
jgi:hypothetical protein